MNPKAILRELNINEPGIYEGSSFVIDLEGSDSWGKVESKLDAGEAKGILEKIDDESSVEYEGAVSIYQYQQQARLILTADFDQDVYSLLVEPLSV